MRIQEALDKIDQMRPNMVRKEIKIAALSELDGLIWQEIIRNHEQPGERRLSPAEEILFLPPEERTYWLSPEDPRRPAEAEFRGYTVETDPGTEMLVKFPYDEVYIWWLASKIDWQNQEMDKYNNDRTLFNNAYDTYSDWYTRTHMPRQRTREFRI